MSQKPKKVPVILQMEALECGAASLCMVLAYYKKWVPLDQVRSDCGVSRDGSNALSIWKAAEGYGMKVKANRFKVEQLQKEATFPAIIWWNHNHFVVLDGFKKGKAVINDPAKGVVRMPIQEFEQNYSILCMQFEPTEKFEPGGKPQSILAFLKKRIKGNQSTLLLVMLTGALSVAAGVLMPVFSRIFTDEILGGDNRDWLTPFLLLFGALILFRLIAGALNAKAIQRATGKIAITSNAQFMWHILRMPMGFFAQRMAGDLSGRQQSNDQVANTLIRQLAPTVMNMMLLVLYLIVMIQYSPLLTAIGVFTILLNILLVQIITQKRMEISRTQMRDQGKLNATTVSGIDMIETIKSAGAENGFFERWSGYHASVIRSKSEFSETNRYLEPLSALIQTLSGVLVLAAGVWLIMDGRFTAGMLLAFQAFMTSFLGPVNQVIAAGQSIQEMRASMERIDDVIDYLVRPLGIMRRRVLLEDRWWKNGDGPLLAVEKETGSMVALIPGRFSGYTYFDRRTNDFVKVNASNKDRFETNAVCFYRPLPQNAMSGRDLVVFLLRHMTAGDAVMILAAILLTTVVGVITPLITQIIFARIIPSGKYELLASAVTLLASAAVGTYLLTSVKTAILSRITNRMDTLLQNGVIGRMLSLPVKFFSDKSAGGLSQSVGSLTLLPSILTEVFFGTGIMVAMSILYIIQIAVMAPALSIPAFLTFVLEIALIAVCMKQKSRLIHDQLKADHASQGLVFALFSGIQKIKLSGSENRAFAKWANLYRDKTAASYKWPFPAFMQNELVVGIQMLGLMVAYISAVAANVTVARFAAFSSAFGLVMAALMQLSACTDLVAFLRPVLEMGETVLGAVPEVSADKKTVDKLSGAVELNNVSFRYEKDGPNIVDGMSLKIEPGEYVAIVGKSGCGKSTLMRLMLGFEDPDDGSIYYGNRDLSTMDLASFRRNVGTVLQSGKLFLGDIYSNITISAPWLNMDDAWEAARMAGMADDIENMPMGMHTIISEGSGGISGGQRQRLMIARAIAPKPSVLMFDEATSALDNLTQKIVADSLSTLKCTRIVIAHRLSTIKDCDRIIVLDSGKIVEDGTYDELIEKKGYFADLVSRQQVDAA